MATTDKKEPDSQKSTSELFRYSAWVHVGAGAEECEAAETGECSNAQHFHAWCRLPNQMQAADLRERSLAAKARRIRQLRDPETDAFAVLEGDMADLHRQISTEMLIDELANQDWWKRQLEAMRDVEEDEEWKTIDRDRERLQELRGKEPDKRPKDEFEELERHVGKYLTAVESRRNELERPIREALAGLSKDELIAQIREQRITQESQQAFMETYSRHEWLAGTFNSDDPLKRQRVFLAPDALTEAAPEVIDALASTFAELEASLQRGPKGN